MSLATKFETHHQLASPAVKTACKLIAVTQGRLSDSADLRSPAVQPDSASCSRQQSRKPTRQEPGDDYPLKLKRQGDRSPSQTIRRTVQPRVRHASRTTRAQATRPTRIPANMSTSQHANNPADRSASVTRNQLVTSQSHRRRQQSTEESSSQRA